MAGDDAAPLVPAEPAYARVLTIQGLLMIAPLLIGAAAFEWLLGRELGLPRGAVLAPIALMGLWLTIIFPPRRRASMAHSVNGEQLRVLRGRTWQSDTIVPFNRVQHIDVQQGPVERPFGLARLVVHTAGNHNSEVVLAGLPIARAQALRDAIRRRIVTEPL